MERGCHESIRDTTSPWPPLRERESWWDKFPNSLSSLLLIYSWVFLLAGPTRKWEGEEAHSCNHTGQPWGIEQVGKGGG